MLIKYYIYNNYFKFFENTNIIDYIFFIYRQKILTIAITKRYNSIVILLINNIFIIILKLDKMSVIILLIYVFINKFN